MPKNYVLTGYDGLIFLIFEAENRNILKTWHESKFICEFENYKLVHFV